MGKYSYLVMDFVLFAPIYLLLFLFINKNKKTVFFGFAVGAIYFFIVDPFAVLWKAWQFNSAKTLAPFFGPTLVEELIWSVLAFGFASAIVRVLSEAEEKGIEFKSIFKK